MTSEIKSYRDLKVWQKGIELVKEVYALTRRFPQYEIYALANQMQRSAVSVPSNIAEGQARQHTGEFRQFLHTALGSLAEVDTQTVIAYEWATSPGKKPTILCSASSNFKRCSTLSSRACLLHTNH